MDLWILKNMPHTFPHLGNVPEAHRTILQDMELSLDRSRTVRDAHTHTHTIHNPTTSITSTYTNPLDHPRSGGSE